MGGAERVVVDRGEEVKAAPDTRAGLQTILLSPGDQRLCFCGAAGRLFSMWRKVIRPLLRS